MKGTPKTSALAVFWDAVCLVLVCVVALFVAPGCAEDFDPFWKVNKFRILAVKATPVTLEPGELARLEVLVHNPDDAEVEYRWEWCPFGTSAQQNYACPMGADELEQVLREQVPPGEEPVSLPQDWFDLGGGIRPPLYFPGSYDDARRLCEGILQAAVDASANSELGVQVPVMDCSRGLELSVRVIATVDGQEYVARKRVLVSTSPETPANANPYLIHLMMKIDRPGQAHAVYDELYWVPNTVDYYPVSRDSIWRPTPIFAGIALEFWANVDRGSIETWTPPAPAGSEAQFLEPERELLSFQWLGTTGEFSDPERLFVPSHTPLDKASKVDFVVPYDDMVEDFDKDGVPNDEDNCAPLKNPDQHDENDENDDGVGDVCDIWVWVVVRDGRLGVDWRLAWLRIIERTGD